MKNQKWKISISDLVVLSLLLCSIVSCAKKGGGMGRTTDSSVLESSSFNPEESAPGVEDSSPLVCHYSNWFTFRVAQRRISAGPEPSEIPLSENSAA